MTPQLYELRHHRRDHWFSYTQSQFLHSSGGPKETIKSRKDPPNGLLSTFDTYTDWLAICEVVKLDNCILKTQKSKLEKKFTLTIYGIYKKW